jgi:hypothetical protein
VGGWARTGEGGSCELRVVVALVVAEGNELDDVALHLLAVVDQRIVVGVEHVLKGKKKRNLNKKAPPRGWCTKSKPIDG